MPRLARAFLRNYGINLFTEEIRRGVEQYVRRWKRWVSSGLGELRGAIVSHKRNLRIRASPNTANAPISAVNPVDGSGTGVAYPVMSSVRAAAKRSPERTRSGLGVVKGFANDNCNSTFVTDRAST